MEHDRPSRRFRRRLPKGFEAAAVELVLYDNRTIASAARARISCSGGLFGRGAGLDLPYGVFDLI